MHVGEVRGRRLGAVVRSAAAACILAGTLAVAGAPAASHSPHDDIFGIAASAAFADDGVVHTISRGFLMRSTDGGATWGRIVDGISTRGSLTALAASPDDPDLLYVASEIGEVLRSDDGGSAWTKVTTLEAPATPTALLVGPGDGTVHVALAEGGLRRSVDRGATWLAADDVSGVVAGLASDPGSARVWAATHDGTLHTSDDGGTSWRSETVPDVDHLASIDATPAADDGEPLLLLGTGDGAVVRSTAAGFEVGREGLPDEPVLGLAGSVDGGELVVYASTATSGVHRSDDGGRTWTLHAEGLTTDGQRDEPEYVGRPDFGPLTAARGADGRPVLFVGGFDGLFRSTDGAERWEEVETIEPTVVVGLAVSPTFARDGTVIVTTYLNGARVSRDRGATWSAVNDGLAEPGFYEQGPDRFARLFGAAMSPRFADDDTGFLVRPRTLLRSTDGATTWDPIEVPGTAPADGPTSYHVLVPAPDRLYLVDTSRGRTYRSEDLGGLLTPVGVVGGLVLALTVHPDDPDRLYAGTEGGVRISSDGGVRWVRPGEPAPWYGTGVAVGVRDGATSLFAGSPRGLWASDDEGATWRAVPLGAEGVAIEAVVTSPTFAEDGVVLVSARGEGLYRSTDGGATFAPIAEALASEQRIPTTFSKPTSPPIAFSPDFARDGTVFASVGSEVLRSTDGGLTWEAFPVEVVTHPWTEPEPAAGTEPAATGGGDEGSRVGVVVGVLAAVAGSAIGVVLAVRANRR